MMDDAWEQRLMQSDGIHPNVEGHIQLEKIIWNSLKPLLEG